MASVPVKPAPATPPHETVEEHFRRLAALWHAETAYLSSTTDLVGHPAYQEMIRMVPEVVPLLLRELEREPDHWFGALMAITGAHPVPETDSGNLDKMTEAWLRWGRASGYRW